MHIVNWIAQQSKSRKVSGSALMQCIKESSCHRIERKGNKPSPRLVYRFGKQDRQIERFLKFRRRILHILNEIESFKTCALTTVLHSKLA